MNKTDEWLTIETLIAGLSEMARDIKEMEDSSSHISDERIKKPIAKTGRKING